MAVTQYIGARYVPIFADPAEWSSAKQYEPLTIVLHEGNSFTSKQFVPVGVDIEDTDYWAETGNYNAQVEAYRQEALRFSDSIQEKAFSFDTVADMQAYNEFYDGAVCHTNGFHTSGDGGGAWYKITNDGTPNGIDVIQCNNFIATLIVDNGIAYPEMYGAIGDGSTDSSVVLNHIFNSGIKNIVLTGYYRCDSDVEVPDVTGGITINGVNYLASALRFYGTAKFVVGGETHANELRFNNFTIQGDNSNVSLLTINNVTNVFLNQINLCNCRGNLIELNSSDIVFIKNCTLSGSNERNIYWPCNGILLNNSSPLYIESCNIWNLNKVVVGKGTARLVSIKNSWCEFNNIYMYFDSESIINGCMFELSGNTILQTQFNPAETFAASRLVKIDTPNTGNNLQVNIEKNAIVYYEYAHPSSFVDINNFASSGFVSFVDNAVFTRISLIDNFYVVNLTASTDIFVECNAKSTADLNYMCNIAKNVFKKQCAIHTYLNRLNVSSDGSSHISGDIFYDNNYYCVDSDGTTRRLGVSRGDSISLFPDPSTVTTQQVAAKVNAIINQFARTGLVTLL